MDHPLGVGKKMLKIVCLSAEENRWLSDLSQILPEFNSNFIRN